MVSEYFDEQGTYIDALNGNEIYYPKDNYPTYFSTGYVTYENVPKQMLPTLFTSNYSPDTNSSVYAEEFPNKQNNVFDVFYIGISNGSSLAPQQNSIVRNCALYDSESYAPALGYKTELYGKFDCKSVVKPSTVRLVVKFNGILASGTQDWSYSAIYDNHFSVQNMIDLINGVEDYPVSYAGFNFNLSDMKDGILWVDNEYMTGFFWLSYDIMLSNRNILPNGSYGGYTYLFPSIGCVFETPRVLFPESISTQREWMIYGQIGSSPYGGDRMRNWGSGLRSRPSGVIPYGMTYETTGTYMFFNASFLNQSYASFYTRGYSGNFTGFNANAPIITGTSSVVSDWKIETLREYRDKFSETQRNLFIPEGRSDFGCTIQIVTFDDIWKNMCLVPVWAEPTHEYEYPQMNSNFWYAEIVNNEYRGNLIRGDKIDENVPEWIITGDSTKSTYNPEIDRPIPEDGESDPDYDKEVKPPLIEGDNIELQLNRTISAFTNFMTLYNITPTQLANFGSSLWTNFNDIKNNPEFAENIYAISDSLTGTLDISQILYFITNVRLYPFSMLSIPDLTTSGNNKIYLGTGKVGLQVGNNNVRILNSTVGILDCGSCRVTPLTPYNDFRDYYNTNITCYLPYCGTVELNPVEVINNTLQCYYAIDFYTGECTALLTLSDGLHNYLIAVSNGTIGVTIPLSASNSAQLTSRHMYDRNNTARLVVSGISDVVNAGIGAYHSDDKVGAFGSIANGVLGLANKVISGSDLKADKIGRSAVLAPSLSGGSGGASFILPDSVYLQIRRGTYSKPNNYAKTVAYPLTKSGSLSTFSGFTICKNVDISSLNCTSEEQNEIKALLESGIYV